MSQLCQIGVLSSWYLSLLLVYALFFTCIANPSQQSCEIRPGVHCDSPADATVPHYTETSPTTRYLLYDINFMEGFNLRLDVYARMASLVKRLGPKWILVLPEWSHLPHWSLSPNQESASRRWETYFDLKSLNKFVRVMEMRQLIQQFADSKVPVDSVLSLEHSENFQDDDFRELYEINEMDRTRNFEQTEKGILNIAEPSMNEKVNYSRLFEIKIEGFDSTLANLIEKHFTDSPIILVSNAEIILWHHFGNSVFWSARRSLRYAEHLTDEANRYRENFLNSSDTRDGTELPDDWRSEQKFLSQRRSRSSRMGGNYVAIHWRQGDFLLYRPNRIPESIDCVLTQIHFVASNLLDEHIESIYISTDADDADWRLLKNGLQAKGHRVFNYQRDVPESSSITPGEIAIIDQLIASHAVIFVGTIESTFSYKIQEQREILNFPSNATFNALCPEMFRTMLKVCKPESVWKIQY